MNIEVVYALPEEQYCVSVSARAGSTIAEVLDQACRSGELGGLNWRGHSVGVFGRVCEPGETLHDGDRLEIYRPLLMDAKAARHRRAQTQRGGISQNKS